LLIYFPYCTCGCILFIQEIAELAYQLNKDVKQRVREIEELAADLNLTNKRVEELEQDNKDKVMLILVYHIIKWRWVGTRVYTTKGTK